MYSLWVTLEVQPEGRKEFLEAITRNAESSVRDEDGCLRFDVIELGDGTNTFAFYEVYTDRAAFEEEHLKTQHFLAYKVISTRVVVPGSQRETGGPMIASF
ncbi:Quinol monooxygenase YgiN [Arthrobacter sp. yr096]|uniref:putative quinol monooxygenase n=1 Tax=Arthrobacter sp. yr096 TaxID=1761750 RepID=UPI0008AB813E|nr:putative quinol monooxygenase [Arthrobacter sp. yr096]SEJ83197.1 Quinol monooxygenase YgiN [Arthrobacter sp. yr096]